MLFDGTSRYTKRQDICSLCSFWLYQTDDAGCLPPRNLRTHRSQLCAEVENVICKKCGIVGCGAGQVALKHVHHVTDVVVVLAQFGLEPCWVQQVALADAG